MAKAKRKEIWVTRKGKAATVADALAGDATRLTNRRSKTSKTSKRKKTK